ncbi:RNA-directed DNA polymerase [Tanacetum coccineum]
MSRQTIWRTSWHRHYYEKGLRSQILLATYIPRCTLYGTFSFIKRKQIHPGSYRLRIEVGEAQAFPTNDARNVVNFLKRLFTLIGIPKALISYRGTHFCNYQMEKAMKRLFPGKLKSRWYGSFSVCKDMKNGPIELYDKDGNELVVNKQREKPYQKSVLDTNRDDDITLDDEGEVTLYLMRRSLEVLRKFHWIILGGRFKQLSHVSSPLLSKPGEY